MTDRRESRSQATLSESVRRFRGLRSSSEPVAGCFLLTELLAEKLTFMPEDRDGRRGFRFQAAGTVEKLVAGLVPGRQQEVVFHAGASWNSGVRWLRQLEAFRSLIEEYLP